MIKKWKALRKYLRGKKTYLLAVETIVEIAVAFLIGDQSILNFVQSKEWNTLKAALALIFVRNGVKTGTLA
ncbi:MAG: hypothetical protein GWP19_00185 [Planctomycetia bacterium]|nr:hypothetical protein [Planctomycetia bacterium]